MKRFIILYYRIGQISPHSYHREGTPDKDFRNLVNDHLCFLGWQWQNLR
jgi:hypothetical protein